MIPIVLIGEAMGADEDRIGCSFVGPSGVELLRQLDESGILSLTSGDRSYISRYYTNGDLRAIDAVWSLHSNEIFRTNVLQFHPPGNDINEVCGPKASGLSGYPPITKGKYLQDIYEPELERLAEEILRHNPNLIICLGNTALWALSGRTGIAKVRGTTFLSSHTVADFKCIGIYHPAAVLRQWELRPTTIMDLVKAKRESFFPDIRRPNCEIWIEPTLEDIETFIANHIEIGCDLLSVDIETSGARITCIGFAPRVDLAIVIPFDDARKPNRSYWPTELDEKRCWSLVRRVLENTHIPKLFQNGVYDIGFLIRSYGIRTYNAKEDTMLAHHALQPESLKGLGYLGSVYTDHGSWKHMRKRHETVKRHE
jgi:uracil-DNA glycosylase